MEEKEAVKSINIPKSSTQCVANFLQMRYNEECFEKSN